MKMTVFKKSILVFSTLLLFFPFNQFSYWFFPLVAITLLLTINGKFFFLADKSFFSIYFFCACFAMLVALTGIISGNYEWPLKRLIYFIYISIYSFSLMSVFLKYDILDVLESLALPCLILTLYLVLLYLLHGNRLYEYSFIGKNPSATIILLGIALYSFLFREKGNPHYAFFLIPMLYMLILSGSLRSLLPASLFFVFIILSGRFKVFITRAIIALLVFATSLFLSRRFWDTVEGKVVYNKFLTLFGKEPATVFGAREVEGRLELVKEAFEIGLNNPVFGVGLENTRLVMATYSHNSFSEVFAGLGVAGVLVLSFFLASLLHKCFFVARENLSMSFYCFSLLFSLIITSSTQRFYDAPVLFVFVVLILVLNHRGRLVSIKDHFSKNY